MFSSHHQEGRADLIFIMCDQLRADFLRAYGCSAVPTPNIDRLAAEGLVYQNASSPYPLCVPARASLLTGLNPLQSGVVSNGHWLRPDRHALGLTTWPERLRNLEYRTSSFGKMHFYPWESPEGFDDRIIAEDKRWPAIQDDYAEFLAQQGLQKFDAILAPEYQETKGAITFPWQRALTPDRYVADQAAAYIRRQPAGRSLAMMIGFPGPHCPYDPCPESLSRVDSSQLPDPVPAPEGDAEARSRFHEQFINNHKKSWHQIDYTDFSLEERKRVRHHYAALIAQIDEELGRIIEALEETGRYDNALIVFTSDHGDHVGDQGRVGKGTFYEPSIHIPLIVRCPGGKKIGRILEPVELSQVSATLLAFAGDNGAWSYPPLLRVTSDDPEPDRPIFGVLDTGVMIRQGNWKLTRYQVGLNELFDLAQDPQESQNLWNCPKARDKRDALASTLDHWLLQSTVQGHAEKCLKQGQPLLHSREFSQRGWRRDYPQPVDL